MKIHALQNKWLASAELTLNEVISQIEATVDQDSDFLVLPEFVLEAPGSAPLDLKVKAQVLARLCEIARNTRTWVITGSWLEEHDGVLMNTMRLLNRVGEVVATVRRPYPNLAAVGSEETAFPIIETDKGKIGLLLGEDFWTMEHSRIQSLRGAQLVLVAAQVSRANRASKISATWGLATLNCVAVAFAGTTAGSGCGGSTLALPNGVVATADEEETMVSGSWDDEAMTGLREADLTFKNTLWFGLWARRKDLYSPLTQAALLSA